MNYENYERTELLITEFDSEDVIVTSGLTINKEEYEQHILS